MTYLLAAHIGGTKVRLGLFEDLLKKTPTKPEEFCYQARYPLADFQDAALMMNQFIEDAKKTIGLTEVTIEKACLAVAGPVAENKCDITHFKLNIDGDRLTEKLKFHCQLINDFQAVAYGIQELKGEESVHEPTHFYPIQKVQPQEGGCIGVIGAATGLGKSFLVQVQLPNQEDSQAYPTEGGHPNFAPRSKLEFLLSQYILNYCRKENQKKEFDNYISIEQIISGRGIVAIYSFLRDCQDDADNNPSLKILQDTLIQEVSNENRDMLKDMFKETREEVKKELKIIKQGIEQDIKNKISFEESEEKVKGQKVKKELEAIEQDIKNLRDLIKTWQIEDLRSPEFVDPAAMISAAALRKGDPLCIKTMKIFLEIFAAEIGNFALQFLPYGGLYIAGGIMPQILPLIDEEFIKIINQKGRLSKEIEKIPIYILKNLEAGLIGAAYYVREK